MCDHWGEQQPVSQNNSRNIWDEREYRPVDKRRVFARGITTFPYIYRDYIHSSPSWLGQYCFLLSSCSVSKLFISFHLPRTTSYRVLRVLATDTPLNTTSQVPHAFTCTFVSIVADDLNRNNFCIWCTQ